MTKNRFGTAMPYAASYVILKKQGKVALVLRGNLPWMAHHWGLPAGKVEIGESFTEGAIREAAEEAGVAIKPDSLQHVLSVHRFSKESDETSTEWVDTLFEATAWDGEPHNAEPHMHDALEWHDPKNLPENTIPAIRAYLEAIENGISYLEYGWEDR